MNNQEPVAAAVSRFLAQDSSQSFSSYVIALSGGADSVALLHAFAQQLKKASLRAVYIDHQLQEASSQWATFNQDLCKKLGLKFDVIKVKVADAASLEAEARKARYKAFAGIIGRDECLLTGHHQDDQAETLLLQLFRGAGPKGLSAMPEQAAFGKGVHARPMLQVSKRDILDYCEHYNLPFVEDPSNQDTQYRRNFLRKKVIPLMETEWPEVKATLARASDIQASTQELIEEVASTDFARCFDLDKGLSISSLVALSPVRQTHVLRYWLQQLDQDMPSQKVMDQVLQQMLRSDLDAQPSVSFGHGAIKRFQGYLIWVNDVIDELEPVHETWTADSDLELRCGVKISLNWLKQDSPELVGKPLQVKTRQGGERFRKRNAEHTTSLKNYFQEEGVRPWQRDRALLILFKGEVRAVFTEHLQQG
ncbi:tRNA lysidine(34) synthetase TilS [Kangiella geojedonensis]|uniref:tRNA(Ile)-lysidine synthase n=1 Tax=Kangiella geojedonensis TaxID=914150 RepID=A0A0F6RCL3_9GAMM|nr:tRNA lysidine(34) synthetase TilS [Kangiella geojedonensis]AKE52513.1 tRNA(Ile)-lysidine synthase [Kangiella geojedonensis]